MVLPSQERALGGGLQVAAEDHGGEHVVGVAPAEVHEQRVAALGSADLGDLALDDDLLANVVLGLVGAMTGASVVGAKRRAVTNATSMGNPLIQPHRTDRRAWVENTGDGSRQWSVSSASAHGYAARRPAHPPVSPPDCTPSCAKGARLHSVPNGRAVFMVTPLSRVPPYAAPRRMQAWPPVWPSKCRRRDTPDFNRNRSRFERASW
jgi:hypothetical protein